MRYLLTLLSLALLILISPPKTFAEDIYTRLQIKAEKIHSIQSRFTQEKHLAMFDEVLISEGNFAFQRPASLRWEYIKPFQAGFILNKDKGIEWDEASGTQQEFTLNSSPIMSMVAKQIIAWTTFDIQWLKGRYDILLIRTSPTTLKLNPKAESAREMLSRIIVQFAPDDTTIDLLELHETDGDFTRIMFTTPSTNTSLPSTTFTSIK